MQARARRDRVANERVYDLERVRVASLDVSAESRTTTTEFVVVAVVGPLAESHVTVVVQVLALAQS